MGDISMRGKGKALKMKKGGALPSNKGASKAGMQSKQGRNFLLPKEEKPKKPKRPDYKLTPPKPRPPKRPPKRPEFGPKPRPMPMPMPDKRTRIEDNLRDFLKKIDRKKAIPLARRKKDGGEMKNLADLFSMPASKGFSKERFKKVLEQAKKMKPTGRLNMDDIKRAMDMITKGAAKKAVPQIKGRLGGPKTSPIKRRVSDALKRQSKIKDPKNKNKKLI